MYIKYSTRKFKASHLERIKSLKDQYALQNLPKTQEEIIVIALEAGLLYLEDHTPYLLPPTPERGKRTAPMGIKDE